MLLWIILYVLAGIIALLILIYSGLVGYSKYTLTPDVTVSNYGQSGIKVGLFGLCQKATALTNTIECDDGLVCDIFDSQNRQGLCKKDLGSPCLDIFECAQKAKICYLNPGETNKTCQISTTGGPGQSPGTTGCLSGYEPFIDSNHPSPGICLLSNGQNCTLDSTCSSGSCFENICTSKLADGSKCLRNENCLDNSGCNTNYQNNGINNNLSKICTHPITHDTLTPIVPCIANSDCPGAAVCTPPYGVCQSNTISSRGIDSICDADHLETCADDIGCATSDLSSVGKCRPLISNWPVTSQCNPVGGKSCPPPTKCSTRFSTPVPPGCIFLSNFECNSDEGCIYGVCTTNICKNPLPDNKWPETLDFKNWQWNPLKNGTVSKWGYVPNPTPLTYFDGSATFPALTNTSELHFVESHGVVYTLMQINSPPLDGNTNADLYYQIGQGNFAKITFTADTSGLSPANVGTFTYQVLSGFFYFDNFTSEINYPRIGFSVQAKIKGYNILLFMVLPLVPSMNYTLFFTDAYADSYDNTLGSYDPNTLTMPTSAAQVQADRGKINFINKSSVSGTTKAYSTTCTLSPVAGGGSLILLDISLTPDKFITIPSNLDILKLERGYSLTASITDDIIYYLTSAFELYVRSDVSSTTGDVLIENNVESFSIDQKTNAVFYVKKDITNSVYVFRASLAGNIYDIPFPMGTTDATPTSNVLHLVKHQDFNSTQFTGDIILHTNTRALPV